MHESSVENNVIFTVYWAILFPILNSECAFAEFSELKTLEELRTCAKTFQDQVTELQASIDGVDIPESDLRVSYSITII